MEEGNPPTIEERLTALEHQNTWLRGVVVRLEAQLCQLRQARLRSIGQEAGLLRSKKPGVVQSVQYKQKRDEFSG